MAYKNHNMPECKRCNRNAKVGSDFCATCISKQREGSTRLTSTEYHSRIRRGDCFSPSMLHIDGAVINGVYRRIR